MTIETLTKNGFTVTLDYDPNGGDESPREYESSTMFGFHRSYASPDTAPDTDPQTARDIAESSDNICLPVWLYSHSGTCYKAAETNPFSCGWDSGLFGFIYMSRAQAREMYGVKRLTEKNRLRALADLAAQVDTYSQWANGELYRWEVTDGDGAHVDSCGGYYGEAYAWTEAQAALETHAKPESLAA